MQMPDLAYSPQKDTISYMEVDRNAGATPKNIHMHDHHEIVLVTSVSDCQVTNNGNTVNIRTPAIWINRAGTFHEVALVTQGAYASRVVFFHPETVKNVPKDLMDPGVLFRSDLLGLSLSDDQAQAFVPLFDLLKERAMPVKRVFLVSILCQMAQLVEEGAQTVSTAVSRSYVFDVIQHIRNTEQKQSISDLADRFHVSPTKLKKDFKSITGLTIGAFCAQQRMQKAVALLQTTRLSVTRIAYDCGFSDESYFIEAFRKKYGLTPGLYRTEAGQHRNTT